MSLGEVMVEELEKLVCEIRRVNDPKLKKQTKRYKNALHNYLANVDSLLKVRLCRRRTIK